MIKFSLIIRCFLSLLFFLCLVKLISIFALSSFGKVEIKMTSTTGDPVQIFYTGGNNNFAFSEKFSTKSTKSPSLEEETVIFRSDNATIQNLRIDLGESPGVYSISKITLRSFFGPPVTITPATQSIDIQADKTSLLNTDKSSWVISTTSSDPFIILSGKIQTTNLYVQYVIPALFALAVLVLSSNISILNGSFAINNYPFLQDAISKNPSSGENFAALDGIRGIAALLVLADHSGLPGFDNAGPIGVVVFFCLSGFLLSMTFAKDPSKISDFTYLKHYFIRRFKRIIPMFYFICIAGYLFKGDLAGCFRTMVFLQGNGVLWSVLQEIYFYLLLPFIIATNFYIFRGKLLLCSLFLVATAISFNNGYLPTINTYWIAMNHSLFLSLFISGMFMCFVFHIPTVRESKILKKIAKNPIISLCCLLLLLFTQHLYLILPSVATKNPYWLYQSNFSFLVAATILFAALSKESLLSRVCGLFPLRAIGIVGYSFYLLHPILLDLTNTFTRQYLGIQLPGTLKFFLLLILTYLASAVTYTYIERPFLKKKTAR